MKCIGCMIKTGTVECIHCGSNFYESCWGILQHEEPLKCVTCSTPACQLSLENGKCKTCIQRRVLRVSFNLTFVDLICVECHNETKTSDYYLSFWCKYCSAPFCRRCWYTYQHGEYGECNQCNKMYCKAYTNNGICFTCYMGSEKNI